MGNPQQLGQKPVTFMRQVISLCAAPFLLEHSDVDKMFPADAIARAKQLLGYVGSIGAYSDSRGAAGIRQEVANSIQKRDGYATTTPFSHADPRSTLTNKHAHCSANMLTPSHAQFVAVCLPCGSACCSMLQELFIESLRMLLLHIHLDHHRSCASVCAAAQLRCANAL